MFFSLGEPPSEEVQEKLRQMHELHEARLTDYHHTLQQMFTSLPQDQTVALQTLFSALSTEESGRLAAHYGGMLSAQLQVRFNLCSSCHVNHDDELNSALAGILNTNADLTTKTPEQTDAEFAAWAEAVAKQVPEEDIRYVSDGQEYLPGMEDEK